MEFNIEDLRVMPTEVIKEKLDKQSEGLDYLDKLCSKLKSENQDLQHENKVLKKVIDKIKKFSKDLYFYNKDVDETIKKECDVYNSCLKNLQEVIEQAEKEVENDPE